MPVSDEMEIDQFELPKEFENVMKRFMPSEEAEEYNEKKEEAPKKKKRVKITLAELKKRAKKPENVEWVDCDARDPLFLVELKSTKNTVPVPGHWSSKRKYLQSKRGIEKLPYELPPYIKSTNISELRQAGKDKEDQQKIKQKVRARLHGKIHKLDIDYQILHDAFFKNQGKPRLTKFGECFYEGKEFELKIKAQRAGGELSDELKRALGMGPKDPPPFLFNMQRYGPPPSYAGLKIPGVNAPIPNNCSWGYHAGGYGKPPVDLHGRSLYGDIFGEAEKKKTKSKNWIKPEPLWGEMIDDTINDDMDVDDGEPVNKIVDMQEDKPTKDVPIQQLGDKGQKPKRNRNRPSGNDIDLVPTPVFTIIEEEKQRIGNDIVGSDRAYKFQNNKGLEPQQPEPSKKRPNNIKDKEKGRKKFKY